MNRSTIWRLLSVVGAAAMLAYFIAPFVRSRTPAAPDDASAISRWDDEGGSVGVSRDTATPGQT